MSFSQAIWSSLLAKAALSDSVQKITTVTGGSINLTQCVQTAGERFFVKSQDQAPIGFFEAEQQGLEALRTAALAVPEVLALGKHAGTSYLIQAWLAPEEPTTAEWQTFGTQLAQMHAQATTDTPIKEFGFDTDNFIATLPQINTWAADWVEFYVVYRIEPLLRQLHDAGDIDALWVRRLQNLFGRFYDYFPVEAPALLHGDLWAGNAHSSGGQIYAIDPAVYYGHRWMDLGMSTLFGGFPSSFYAAYAAEFPLPTDWRRLVALAQIYPLLVHIHLFGAAYVPQLYSTLKPFVKG